MSDCGVALPERPCLGTDSDGLGRLGALSGSPAAVPLYETKEEPGPAAAPHVVSHANRRAATRRGDRIRAWTGGSDVRLAVHILRKMPFTSNCNIDRGIRVRRPGPHE